MLKMEYSSMQPMGFLSGPADTEQHPFFRKEPYINAPMSSSLTISAGGGTKALSRKNSETEEDEGASLRKETPTRYCFHKLHLILSP